MLLSIQLFQSGKMENEGIAGRLKNVFNTIYCGGRLIIFREKLFRREQKLYLGVNYTLEISRGSFLKSCYLLIAFEQWASIWEKFLN